MTAAASDKPPLFRGHTTLDQLNALSRNTAMEPLGIVFSEIGPDYLRATMPVDRRTHQPYGLLHGGASVLLAVAKDWRGTLGLKLPMAGTRTFMAGSWGAEARPVAGVSVQAEQARAVVGDVAARGGIAAAAAVADAEVAGAMLQARLAVAGGEELRLARGGAVEAAEGGGQSVHGGLPVWAW